MPRQNPESPNSVIGKVCSILAQFSLEKSVLTLDEISQGSHVPRTTTHRILQNLTDEGYIDQLPMGYRLGLRISRLGMIAQRGYDLSELLNELLAPLAEQSQETILTSTLEQDQIVHLHVIESPSPLRFVAGAGQRRDARYGATGLALLSSLSDVERQAYVQEPLPQFTSKTITDANQWLERLDQIAQRGVAIERGEYVEGIEAIAILASEQPRLALTVVGPEERMKVIEQTVVVGLHRAAEELKKIPLPTF